MTKRLTEKQKEEMVRSFKSGMAFDVLSQNYSCTKSTIIRNLKKNLGEKKYKELVNKNNSLKGKNKKGTNLTNNLLNSNLDDKTSKKATENVQTLGENRNDSKFLSFESFFEIPPLDYEIENAPRKELSSVPISEVDFPKVVYMVVDKKIELEIKLLKDFPEWDFLPHDDLSRKTIEIFFDLKLAKRSCNKEQKVLKVPNTDVFRIAAPVLLEKGISRIVCAENLIAL
ncbi:hypothetical protein [Prochlorococcus marinus]|uniref:hypothetical protein n=1 Tax=Prochlorococcus marinus TaxID=1219 RepID=UPI00094D94C7